MATGRGKHSKKEDPPDVKLSKFLSYICRHGAEKEGIPIRDGGFLNVHEVLSKSREQYSKEDVERVVAQCSKQRFALRNDPITGSLQIRANQGHTIPVDDLELTPIVDANGTPMVVHGTYRAAWNSIKLKGLSRMQRNHIHFSPGLPGESGVISGMRSSCEILIFIDLPKALAGGLKFFRSANNVILSPGNHEGIIPPEYFAEVREHSSGKVIAVY
ncbi:hypothetical protein EMCRGX_G032669 [Ephydatia muelleri]